MAANRGPPAASPLLAADALCAPAVRRRSAPATPRRPRAHYPSIVAPAPGPTRRVAPTGGRHPRRSRRPPPVRARDAATGPAEALREVEAVAPALEGYHLWHATRAELLSDLGRSDEAAASAGRALERTANPAERHLLAERLQFYTAGA